MPRIVDHESRRAELADAARRVILREGVAGATVRVVAQESGWSPGAVRHYFGSQDELLAFTFEAMLGSVEARVRQVHATQRPGRRRAQSMVEQLVPLDDERHGEVAVYLAFLSRRTSDRRFADLTQRAFEGEQLVCASAIADLGELPRPPEPRRMTAAFRAAVEGLQASVDGLALLGTAVPERMPPAKVRRLLRDALDRASLTSGEHVKGRPPVL